MTVHRRRWLAVAASVLLVPGLGGCWQGSTAATVLQQEGGNGSQVTAGSVTVQAITLVAGNTGSGEAALLATMVNPDGPDDALEAVELDGRPAVLSTAPITATTGESVKIGTDQENQVDFTGVSKQAGEYADVTMTFALGGEVSVPVLIVPPVGYYEPAAPTGTTPQPRPTFEVHGGEE